MHKVIPPLLAYFYQLGDSNPLFFSRISQIEALKCYEEVIESSWRLLPGCAVIQSCLGLCTPATRNGQLHRRPSGNRRASPHGQIHRIGHIVGRPISSNGERKGGDPASARYLSKSRSS